MYDTIYATACNAFVLNDSVYLETGEYTQYLLSDLGCDSILTVRVLSMKIQKRPPLKHLHVDLIFYNGIVYQFGQLSRFWIMLRAAIAFIRLNIVISNLQAEIIKEDTILKATTGETNYQWINCIMDCCIR